MHHTRVLCYGMLYLVRLRSFSFRFPLQPPPLPSLPLFHVALLQVLWLVSNPVPSTHNYPTLRATTTWSPYISTVFDTRNKGAQLIRTLVLLRRTSRIYVFMMVTTTCSLLSSTVICTIQLSTVKDWALGGHWVRRPLWSRSGASTPRSRHPIMPMRQTTANRRASACHGLRSHPALRGMFLRGITRIFQSLNMPYLDEINSNLRFFLQSIHLVTI
jgi:hypothetical protein